jgi:hypothetical protein
VGLNACERSAVGASRRAARPGIPGLLLAFVAFCLQLLAPGLDAASFRSPSTASDFAGVFGAHALCIAGDVGGQTRDIPGDSKPAQSNQHVGACCLWHGNSGPCIPGPATVKPLAVSYAAIFSRMPPTIVVAALLPGTFRARAPPIGA